MYMKKSEKSKYYWDFDRNLDNAKQMNQLNPKMLLTKEELGFIVRRHQQSLGIPCSTKYYMLAGVL